MNKEESITNYNKPISLYKLQYFDFLILILLSLVIIATNLAGVYSREFIADYCITFEGGYRIFKGQIPYLDFYLPVGPTVFYIQALFNLIFGPTVLALGMHSSITAIILSAYCYYILRQNFNYIISFLLSYSLFISYCGYISFPWYTMEAFFFLLFNLLILIDNRIQTFNLKLLIASVLLCTFSFFSKQDVGILHFAFLTIYIYLFSSNNLLKKIKHAFIFTVSFLFVVIFIMNIFNQSGNFFYWFNLGQYPHSSRLEGATNIENLRYITRASVLTVALFGIYLWFADNSHTTRRLTFILISINVISFLVSLTSHTADQSLNEPTTLTVIILLRIFLKDITWLIQEKRSILCMIFLSFCLPP